MTFDEIKKIREACLSHAGELLAVSKQIEATAPHIAYHLAALALEEIGKAQILLIEATPGRPSEVERSFEKMRDDHVKKLFWAIWGQTFTAGQVGPDEFRDVQGLARTIHEKRLAGLYVDWQGGTLMIPAAAVSSKRVQNLIALAEARLGIERAGQLKEPSTEERELAAWFMRASRDGEQSQIVFGRKSIEQLNNLRDARAWISWLKNEFEEQQKLAQQQLERELRRAEPSDTERDEAKWRVRVRFYTPSHSIRQSVLARFNKLSEEYLKLYRGGKPNELIVDYTFPKGLHVGWLWDAGLSSAEHILLALNIASFGFFWWQPARYTATYFERIEDLEAKSVVRVERVPRLEVNWGKGVVDDAVLNRLALVLGCVPLPKRQRSDEDPFRLYLDGLSFFGKTDVHMQMELNAFERFFSAFKAAAKMYGDWDGQSDFRTTASAIIDRLAADAQSWREYVEIGTLLSSGANSPRTVNLGDAAGMKVWCDLYFCKMFEGREHGRVVRTE